MTTNNNNVTFGWVMPTAPRGAKEEIEANPNEAVAKHLETIEQHLRVMQPHIDTVWITDHFQFEKTPILEAITTLSYLMGRYEDMRFGNLVLAQSFRNPALTAKMAANLQAMSGGRFILGIGAGWHDEEYRGYGYEFHSAGVRIEQLDEAVQVIRAMWTQSPATFKGKYHSIENAECQPQPDPPIPILIGGSGEKKTLRVVARHADWWSTGFVSPEEYARKQGVLAGHCEAVGRDPNSIVYNYDAGIRIVEDTSEIEKRDAYFVEGTPQMVADELAQFIELGVTHFQLRIMDFPKLDSLQALVEEVIPRLKRET